VLGGEGRPVALIGSGGSGKSVLAGALGHRLARHFGGEIHWFRVGAWDYHTLLEILALRLGIGGGREHRAAALRRVLSQRPRLIILDNHEADAAMARLLDELAGTAARFVITARRCLLAGVAVFPVTAPLSTSGRAAFPRVARLTSSLRGNPLALDIADALVGSGATTVAALAAYLKAQRVDRVRVIAHEDDLPEVALLVAWAWTRLPAASRRMLGVLAHVGGDHMDRSSLGRLARVGKGGAAALARLERWHLVQQPMPGRFAVHAVVGHAVRPRTRWEPARAFEHYLSLLERSPGRLALEQSHLFAAMDHADRRGDLDGLLRIGRLVDRLAEALAAPDHAPHR